MAAHAATSPVAGTSAPGEAAGPPLFILPYRVAEGAVNMALDEAMLDAARRNRTLLRFYGWDPWCLSLGRNQPAPPTLLGRSRSRIRPGVDVVRRPTGGRSVYHGPEVTYAFACPDRAWGGPRAVYRRVHEALAAGLASLGVVLDARVGTAGKLASSGSHGAPASSGGSRPAGLPPRLAPSTAGCFRDPAPGELTAGGRKVVGSAQCRQRGALLQHGSILIENRQALGDLGRSTPGRSTCSAPGGDPAAIGLDQLVSSLPPLETIVETLTRALASAFRNPARGGPEPSDPRVDPSRGGHGAAGRDPGQTVCTVRRQAHRLEARHRDPDWLWRRVTTTGAQ